MASAPGAAAKTQAALAGLRDVRHLERERAKLALDLVLKSAGSLPDEECSEVLACVDAFVAEAMAADGGDEWATRLAGLTAGKSLLSARLRCESVELRLQRACMDMLEDDEVRVRVAVGDVLQALAQLRGGSVLAACMERVLLSIHENYDRDGEGAKARRERGDVGTGPASPTASQPNSRNSSVGDLLGMLLESSYKVIKPGTGELRHGTEGWHSLESSCRALGQMLEGAGADAREWMQGDLLVLIARSQHHPNRFVREVSHYTVGTVAQALAGDELVAAAPTFVQQLADGLSDGWSQVRYAASVATRTFLQSLPAYAHDDVLPTLLPPMCLNRYYEAEGVRRFSQQTWREVMGDNGRAKVAQFAPQVVAYYVAQSKSNSHSVRESACACIAELMEKVDRAAVAPHVGDLLRALMFCFKDMGWPVRDAACTAFGRCVLSHPAETAPVLERELWALWLAHLWDNIPSVRRNTAVAAANAVRSFGMPALEKLLPALWDMLPRARDQPPDQTAAPEGAAGAGDRALDNDHGQHTGQEMFSCTTLATRTGKDYFIKSDGCMDYGFNREREPWEASDGALQLLEQLALLGGPPQAPLPPAPPPQPQQLPPSPTPPSPDASVREAALSAVLRALPLLPDLAELRSFAKAHVLRESVWRVLPTLGRALGKQKFKANLELLLPPMFTDLACGYPLTEAAAGRCIIAIRPLIGAMMFEARLTPEQLERLRTDANVLAAESEAARASGGAGGGWPAPAAAPAAPGMAGIPAR